MTPASYMPVVFVVSGTEISVAAHCAVFPASRHPDDAPVDDETAAVFEDIGTVFAQFIQHGIVLQPPVGELASCPVSGEMMPSIPLKTSLPARSVWMRFLEWFETVVVEV
ncbi:hypothetical protein GSI_07345 [Ganoderma sinense ZZ0214-1]|uniref:Uncharacterized protein n=1 Tax=Ganoderma sinense ZZ0214-1 TaxID=1077348 RepID=A0A2G8SA59_9APHY|nr:hypothetical protein GSI_07345 [Ganoderma sinense ZZ0214-1]